MSGSVFFYLQGLGCKGPKALRLALRLRPRDWAPSSAKTGRPHGEGNFADAGKWLL